MAQADPSTKTNPNTTSFLNCLDAAQRQDQPFTYWLLQDALTEEACQEIVDLPISPPKHVDYPGTRESHNESRSFFNEEACARHPVCGAVAETFSDQRVRGAIERTCGIDLSEGQLRIEYTLDSDGFWLEPHTDISEKLFTMLIYLSDEPEAAGWGTDIYDADFKHVGTAPYGRNLGLYLYPGRRHLARLPQAADQGRAALAHRQLRHARLARASRAGAGLIRRSPKNRL